MKIDQVRQQVQLSSKLRELSDVQLQAVIVQTTRNVNNGLTGIFIRDQQPDRPAAIARARGALAARQPAAGRGRGPWLRSTSSRPSRGRHQRAKRHRRRGRYQANADRLRALIFDPDTPNFWTTDVEPTDAAPFQEQAIDRRCRHSKCARQAVRSQSDEEQPRAKRHEHSLLSESDLPDIARRELHVDRDQRHATEPGRSFLDSSRAPFRSANLVADRSFSSVLGDILQTTFRTGPWELQSAIRSA